jgi:hypothetical protein
MNDRAPQAVPAQLTESKGTNLARELFTGNFWMSGLAMLKYIPRSFRVKQVDGMAFFTEAKHDEFGTGSYGLLLLTRGNGERRTSPRCCITSIWRVAVHLASTDFRMRAIRYREHCFDGFWWIGSLSNPKGCDYQRVSRFPTPRNSTSILKSNSCSKSWMLPGLQDRPTIGDRTPCSAR